MNIIIYYTCITLCSAVCLCSCMSIKLFAALHLRTFCINYNFSNKCPCFKEPYLSCFYVASQWNKYVCCLCCFMFNVFLLLLISLMNVLPSFVCSGGDSVHLPLHLLYTCLSFAHISMCPVHESCASNLA